jgi:hypothetical protein
MEREAIMKISPWQDPWQRRRVRFRPAWALLAALLVIGCDPSDYVYLTNRTDVRITLYQRGRAASLTHTLDPGQVARDTWMYPISPEDRRKIRIEADGPDGTLLFCHDFSYQELKTANWHIDVRRGQLDCT